MDRPTDWASQAASEFGWITPNWLVAWRRMASPSTAELRVPSGRLTPKGEATRADPRGGIDAHVRTRRGRDERREGPEGRRSEHIAAVPALRRQARPGPSSPTRPTKSSGPSSRYSISSTASPRCALGGTCLLACDVKGTVVAGARSDPSRAHCPRLSPDARADLIAAFERWESPIRDGLQAMHDRCELPDHVRPDALGMALADRGTSRRAAVDPDETRSNTACSASSR